MAGSGRPKAGQQRGSIETTGGEAVCIWLLGGFRTSVGPSRSIGDSEWRLRKAGSLLKLLALAPGHRLHREQATDLLWPELDSEAATNNLHHALHIARRTLEPSISAGAASNYLQLREGRLALCPDGPLWVDVGAFEEAATTARYALETAVYRAAIDLYSGELLPQDRYEPWVEQRRAELRELYLSLLVELAGLYEEHGEYGSAIEALSSVVAEEPTHEGAHVGLMRLCALSGQRREALRQYERLREALSKEFGSEPELASSRLQQEIWTDTFPPVHSPPSAGFPEEPPFGAGVARHNLPLARTSFVGRERETREVRRLLTMTGLLTLTGAGGCGKTRLALEVARGLASIYPGGVWLVELGPLSDPALMSQAVAEATGVREIPGRPLEDTLTDHLRTKNLVLVLDNCEHLVDKAAHLADALLGSCPKLRILATSREPLGVRGEAVWTVPPLSLPDVERVSSIEGLMSTEAVQLFLDRARSRLADFELTRENAGAVRRNCRKLEGIPLAIELAAARMGALAVEQVAQRLEDSLKLLPGGGRTVEPRQQTLRATLDWSHELLSEPERWLFRRLSVFAGGWTLEAAEGVCSGGGIERDEVLDPLARLVDKSLVVAEASPGADEELRYRMLEPIRQYGEEHLEESREAERIRERHAGYYRALAEETGTEEAEPPYSSVGLSAAWLKRMYTEHGNLRAALSWSLDEDAEEPGGQRAESGLRLAIAMYWFWQTHDYLTEGRRWLEMAASRRSSDPTTTSLRARALNGAAWIALHQADYGASKTLMEESLALHRELGDGESIAAGLADLGKVAVLGQRDDIPLAVVLQELGELKPGLKNRNTLASLLILEGLVALSRGELERSATLHEESLKLCRETRDTQQMILCLGNLGITALLRADYEGAVPPLREGLRLGWETDYKVTIQFSFNGLAYVAAGLKQPVRAARLWGAVEGMQEAYGVHVTAIARTITDHEARQAAARSQLEEEVWSEAWAEGKAMPLERAIEYALSEGEDDPPAPLAVLDKQPPSHGPTERLTRREREVALLIERGFTNRQIASELSISDRTVENHVHKILKKLGFSSRARIAAWVVRQW